MVCVLKGESDKMKKFRSASFIAAVLAAAIMIVSASGCSKGKNNDETTTENAGYTEDAAQETTGEENTEADTSAAEEESTAEAESTTANTPEQKTEQESSRMSEETTKATSETVKPDPATKAPDAVSSKSEFDMLVSDSFYITGKTVDEKGASEPLEMAKTKDTLYFLSDLDGVTMGAIMTDKTAYMVCDEKKAYLEISLSTLKTFGIDSSMTDVSSYSFSDLKSLANAVSVKENCEFYGSVGTEYTFKREKSVFYAYMKGTKLLGFTTTNTDGTEPKTTVISTITGTVPSNKTTPPSDYKKYKGMVGAIGFMSAIGKN